jgi:hypothetical protein
MSEISVCIPLHDPRELHYDFLQEALESISIQTLYPKEVLIAGSYKPTYLDKLLETFNKFFPVKFIKNKSTSTSSNLNLLVPYSSGSIVKILFQDDFLISNTALEITNHIFLETNTIWAACMSRNYNNQNGEYTRNVNPKFRNKLAKGINSIGSPSVVSFKKNYYLPFNENLVWMLDCEWYLQMQHRFGNPYIIKNFQIANRLHQYQATHNAKVNQGSELIIVNNLHLKSKTSNSFFSNKYRCVCLRNYHE